MVRVVPGEKAMPDSTQQVVSIGITPPAESMSEMVPSVETPSLDVLSSVIKTDATPRLDSSALWLRRSDQFFVGVSVTALLILLAIQWVRLSHWGSAPVELTSQKPRTYHYSLDINTASWVEWAQLDGIGEKLARRIVADREERGTFRTPADVGRVRGIGPKVLEKLIPYLQGGTDSTNRTQDVSP